MIWAVSVGLVSYQHSASYNRDWVRGERRRRGETCRYDGGWRSGAAHLDQQVRLVPVAVPHLNKQSVS